MKFKLSLLTSMLFIGLVYGLSYHYVVMLIFGENELIHCVVSGILFSLIMYFVSIRVFRRFYDLKEINKNLEKNIDTDKLTSLYNRSAFDNDILNISEYKAYSLIFIDIDNFRRFNNEFGHKAGDIVLQKVSQTIKNNIRCDDRAYRYGGEEIIILLKNCNKYKAFEIAEKIRINISKIDNFPLPSITVSLGVANYPEDGDDISNIVESSDNALLTAKMSGENCTITYNSKICCSLQ